MALSRKSLLEFLSNRFVGEQERIIIRHLIDAQDRIVELEAKLAALDWTPITAGNLPKGPSGNYAGDEVMRMNPHTPAHVYTVERDCPDMATAQALCDTHRRPINPPQEPS